MLDVTKEAERAYVRNWVDTGRLLDQIRWRELGGLDNDRALRASDALLDAAVSIPPRAHRRSHPGLVDLQDLLHHRRRR